MRSKYGKRQGAPHAHRRPGTPEGLRALLILIVLAAIICGAFRWFDQRHSRPATGTATTQPTGTIRIATWNLKKFSEQGNPDFVMIAGVIRSSRFDLLAIQEVQQQGQAVQRLRRQLGEPWRHAISERTGNNERFAFLYRGDILEVVNGPAFMQSAEAAAFARVPFTATFRAGQFDFTLVTIHLSYTDTNHRRREADALARFAKDLAANAAEKDVIVLGDFNDTGSGELRYFDSQGWTKLNHESTNLSSSEIYDNLLIDPKYTREWTGGVGVVRFDETCYQNDDKRAADDVSDHRPVWADFATAGPDDD
jgi:endonuclease/exonuclease/phosphatase family metal-dependent hydrolase